MCWPSTVMETKHVTGLTGDAVVSAVSKHFFMLLAIEWSSHAACAQLV